MRSCFLAHWRAAWLVLGAAAFAASSQAQDLPRGRVVETVVCRDNPGQTYALYLPARYSPDRRWPILYAFDAAARGALPVERFKDAAERYGYIIAGSNNSRNGPMTIADEALRAIVTDTQSRLALDPQRVYVTGFSGGARVAVVAGLALRAAGVIGCGAGFHPSLQPSSSLPFVYFGVVGTDDFNYPELVALDRQLDGLGLQHRVEVFEGGHDWPPSGICTHAIEWMELQAIRKKIRQADEGVLDAILANAVAEAGADERDQRLSSARDRYAAIVSDFAGLRDVAPFDEKARDLTKSKQVKSAVDERRASIELQRSTEATVSRLIDRALSRDERPLAVQELADTFADLHRQSKAPQDSALRMVARRLLASAWIQLNAATSDDFERGDVAQAAARLELMAFIRPQSAQVDYLLARALARGGKKQAAVEALQHAVKKGFTDSAAVEREPDFASLAGDDAFRALVARLKAPR